MRFKKIIRLFDQGNVSVCGLRGRGKDLLMANVVVRRKLPYVCNIDYGGERYELDFDLLDCGCNTYDQFISGNVNKYVYPYPDGTDVYISDCGIYLPAQYCNELNKKYPHLPVFFAISRHVGNCNVHTNSQSLSRVWDKAREQSDIYILCRKCFYISGLVIQFITVYDRYQSALDRQKPLRLSIPVLASSEAKMSAKIMREQYEAAHGVIKNRVLIYKNRSSYNTRQFKEILEGGKVQNEENDVSQAQLRSYQHKPTGNYRR